MASSRRSTSRLQGPQSGLERRKTELRTCSTDLRAGNSELQAELPDCKSVHFVCKACLFTDQLGKVGCKAGKDDDRCGQRIGQGSKGLRRPCLAGVRGDIRFSDLPNHLYELPNHFSKLPNHSYELPNHFSKLPSHLYEPTNLFCFLPTPSHWQGTTSFQ